jgi:hypothetical protein
MIADQNISVDAPASPFTSFSQCLQTTATKGPKSKLSQL